MPPSAPGCHPSPACSRDGGGGKNRGDFSASTVDKLAGGGVPAEGEWGGKMLFDGGKLLADAAEGDVGGKREEGESGGKAAVADADGG